MNFTEAIKSAFNKYATIDGRASRSEYWWFYLFILVISLFLETIDDAYNLIFLLITLVPLVTVTTRRFHDINKSGWWQLIVLTIIGIIPLIIWMCVPGDKESNRFGEPPLLSNDKSEPPSDSTPA